MINKWFDFSISRGVRRYSSLQGIMSNKLLDIQRDILEMIFNEVLSCRETESFGESFVLGTRSMIRFVICSKACYKVVKVSKYDWLTQWYEFYN